MNVIEVTTPNFALGISNVLALKSLGNFTNYFFQVFFLL